MSFHLRSSSTTRSSIRANRRQSRARLFRVLERTLGFEELGWIVAEEFLDIGRAKLAKAGEQQIAVAELEGRDGQHGLRLVGQASGAQLPRLHLQFAAGPPVPRKRTTVQPRSVITRQCACHAPRCVRVCVPTNPYLLWFWSRVRDSCARRIHLCRPQGAAVPSNFGSRPEVHLGAKPSSPAAKAASSRCLASAN